MPHDNRGNNNNSKSNNIHNSKVGIDMQTIRADLKKRFEFRLELAVESILSGNIVESLFNN